MEWPQDMPALQKLIHLEEWRTAQTSVFAGQAMMQPKIRERCRRKICGMAA